MTEDGITITSVSPSTGPATGGTSVLIRGSNLPEHPRVLFGDRAGNIQSKSATSILVTSPAGSGTVDITVADHAGNSVTMRSVFEYTGSQNPTTPTTQPSSPSEPSEPSNPTSPTTQPSSPSNPGSNPPVAPGAPRQRFAVTGPASTRGGLTLVAVEDPDGLFAAPATWASLACRSAVCTARNVR